MKMRENNLYRSLTSVAAIEAVLVNEIKEAEINYLVEYGGLPRKSAEIEYALGHRVFTEKGEENV